MVAKKEIKKRTFWNTGLKDAELSRKETVGAALLGLAGLSIVVMYLYRPFANVSEETITGILAADGLLFGFWAALIGITPKERKARWKHLGAIKRGVFLSLAVLIASVYLIYGNALGFLPSSFVLFVTVYSFYFTSVFLGITLYYGMFEG